MSITTDALKGSYIRIYSYENRQKTLSLMYKLGFKWVGGGSGHEADMYNDGYLYVDTNCRIWQTDNDRFFDEVAGQNFGKFKEIYFDTLTVAVQKHAEEKRKQKRINRLKKKGWIENKGVDPQLEACDVIYKCFGTSVFNRQSSTIWGKAWADGEIILYRPSNQRPPQQKSKWTKWAADEHNEYPGNPKDFVEIVYNDGLKTTGGADGFFWDKGECPADDIRKYRVVKAANNIVPVSFEEMVEDIVKDAVEVVEKPVDTNPKKQFGDKSVPLHMWSGLASAYGALALYNGSLKYGGANFTNTPVEASIYIAAAFRHLNAWIAGEEFDPVDGVPNLGGVLANIAILLEARAAGTLIDNRLKMDGYLKEREALKEIVTNLQKLHEGKNPKHYTLE